MLRLGRLRGYTNNALVTVDLPKVDPESGLEYSYAANLYARSLDSGRVEGWNISFAAENTTANVSPLAEVPGSMAPRSDVTEFSVVPLAYRGEQDVFVLYSSEGDDITLAIGSSGSGEWTEEKVPIPTP